jgi:cation:H+ antiporter
MFIIFTGIIIYMNAYFLFLIGLAIITIGSELLLKGASKIASLLGVRPIVIGLTVVSIGTSLPELAVGLAAVQDGAADMALANIAGTNIVNILLILGLSAAIRPLPIQVRAITFEMYIMIFTAFLLFVLCLDGTLSYWDGLIMLLSGIVYIIVLIRKSRQESLSVIKEYVEEYRPSSILEKENILLWGGNILILIVGIAATIWGAEMLVAGATDIARAFGLSDAVIGLTIIAIGTSAPELVTTLVATYKDDRDVAIGNLLGSSITNVLFILSTTTLLVPGASLHVDQTILWVDLPLAALVALICFPVFKSGQRVSRTEGVLFVLAYITYLSYLLYWRVE